MPRETRDEREKDVVGICDSVVDDAVRLSTLTKVLNKQFTIPRIVDYTHAATTVAAAKTAHRSRHMTCGRRDGKGNVERIWFCANNNWRSCNDCHKWAPHKKETILGDRPSVIKCKRQIWQVSNSSTDNIVMLVCDTYICRTTNHQARANDADNK